MSREWGPTGIVDGEPFEFSEETTHQLVTQLRLSEQAASRREKFLASLSKQVGHYLAYREVATESSPAAVRKNLKSAIKVAIKLNDLMNDMDANSKLLIDKASDNSFSYFHGTQLRELIQSLILAGRLADQYPSRGRLKDFASIYLAIGVADALESHLRMPATSTKEGPFEATLAILLEAATKRPRESTHDLACTALAIRKEAQKAE